MTSGQFNSPLMRFLSEKDYRWVPKWGLTDVPEPTPEESEMLDALWAAMDREQADDAARASRPPDES